MGFFRFFVLAGASLVSLQLGKAQAQDEVPQTDGATRVPCHEAFNAPRTEIGFSAFGQAEGDNHKLPVFSKQELSEDDAGTNKKKQEDFVNSVCDALKNKTATGFQTANKDLEGTYMYYSQKSDQNECPSAVNYWKGALDNFTELPPAYSDGGDLYKNQQNISFIGLYNPAKTPTVDCAVVTCYFENPTAAAGVPASVPTTKKTAVYSLVCLSSPDVFQGSQKPFTQEQWNAIKGEPNSSAHATLFASIMILVGASLVHTLS